MTRRVSAVGVVIVAALLAPACNVDRGTSPLDRRVQRPYADVTVAVGVEARCKAITPEQMELFGIEQVEWMASDGTINFPHCKILSSVAKSGAEFAATYKLSDFNTNIPSVALSRIACTPTTRIAQIIVAPGSSTDWTGRLGANLFRSVGRPASGCIAVTMAQHPSLTLLGTIGLSDAQYLPPNSGWDYVTGLHAIAQNASAMMHALFFDELTIPADQQLTACVGVSMGGLLGFQLMDDSDGLACDGLLISVSGDGYVSWEGLLRSLCFGDRKIPLTGQQAELTCAAKDMARGIGIFDKIFREEVLRVLAAEGEEAALALIRDYNVSTAAPSVQQLARRLTPTGALKRPTIIIHSTHDITVPALLALRYMNRVIAHQKQSFVRFYLAPALSHDFTVDFASPAAGALLLKWMTGEAEPHDLVFSVPGIGTMTVKNSKDAGFETDPCGYFDFIFGAPACVGSGLLPPPH